MLAFFVATLASGGSTCGAWEAEVVGAFAHGGCPSAGLMAAGERARASGEHGCVVDALHLGGASPAMSSTRSAPSGAPSKELRQVYSGLAAYLTDNFAVWWDVEGGIIEDADAVALAEAFEASWVTQHETMGYPAPLHTDDTLFNVYIGDSGPDAPSASGAAGYYTVDSDLYPFVVISAGVAVDHDYAKTVVSHEFFHAVQDATHSPYGYGDGQVGAWFWEASAVWMETEEYPGNDHAPYLLFGFAFLPELPVDFFDYPDQGATQEFHQYGAFIFIRYLTDYPSDWSLVQRAWVEPESGDPLAEFDRLLAEDGTTLDEAFTDFVARNATWDYPFGATYELAVQAMGGWESSQSHRPSGIIHGDTDGEWVVADTNLPRGYGANYWEFDDIPAGLSITFEGDEGPEAWHAVLAQSTAGERDQRVIPLDDGLTGTLELIDLAEVDELWLVVAALDDARDPDLGFGYQFRIEEIDVPEAEDAGEEDADPEEQPAGCGCATGGAGGLGTLALAGLSVWCRRRPRSR